MGRIVPQRHTVSDVLNIVSFTMRRSMAVASNCHELPDVCLQEALARADNDEPVSPLMLEATNGLLQPAPTAPASTFEDNTTTFE